MTIWNGSREGVQRNRGKSVPMTAPPSKRYIAHDMAQFESLENEILTALREGLGGREPVLDYHAPHQQHYVVLVDEGGAEVRSRILSEITLAYDHAKEKGLGGTLASK
jgi:hypothetical protein